MSNIAIRVDHLSKLYHIGRAQQRHDTLRDVLSSVFSRQVAVRSRQVAVRSRQFSAVSHIPPLTTRN
jgi:hypothetical protein